MFYPQTASSTATAMPTSLAEPIDAGSDATAIARVLSNPQMMAILAAMSKAMSSDG